MTTLGNSNFILNQNFQWSDEKDWIKSLCIKYVTYIFSMAIRPHVCGSSHITKPKKNEKLIQCPPIKSPPFFLKVMVFMHLLFKKCKKTHFFNGFSIKFFKILNGRKFC
jgi:hypothetical protein